MEKRHRRGLSLALCLFAHMFFPALSPDPVDNRITAFE